LLEACIRPVRDGQPFIRRGLIFSAKPESRRHEMSDDLAIECIAGDCDTVVAQNFSLSRTVAHPRADRKNGKVAGSATEVANENQLITLQCLLVAVRGRHRLVFKGNILEAGRLHRRAQLGQREFIGRFRSFIGEIDGSACHDARWNRA
jgi:hypothetical protein